MSGFAIGLATFGGTLAVIFGYLAVENRRAHIQIKEN